MRVFFKWISDNFDKIHLVVFIVWVIAFANWVFWMIIYIKKH
jgi:hypothetical protein